MHKAVFSYDRQLIATTGKYDQTVKIWNRLSFDIDNVDFDFCYLPHPGIVTHLRWRTPFHQDQTVENTLYTTATDGVIRMWAPFDTTDHANFQLWMNLDLYNGEHKKADEKRFVFVIDNKDVSKAIESTILRLGENGSSSLQNAISVVQRSPELCIIIDESRTMTIYSIENIGPRYKSLTKVTKVGENIVLPKRFPVDSPFLQFFAFANPRNSTAKLKDMSIFVHDFRGTILHYTAFFDRFLDPKVPRKHMRLKSILTGHNKSVQRLLRTADGTALLSMSRFSENYLWRAEPLEDSFTLRRQCSINEGKLCVQQAAIIGNGDYLVTMTLEKLCLWDCRTNHGTPIAHKKVLKSESPICFFLLPEAEQTDRGYHIFALYKNKAGNLWKISLPTNDDKPSHATITDLGSSEFPHNEEIHLASRVDPVGWEATVAHDHIDTYQRDVLATITSNGCFRSWTASLSNDDSIDWLQTASLETGKENITRMEVSSIKKVAITSKNATELSIWDLKNHILEFQKMFDTTDAISDLDWTSTPRSQSILAVGSSSIVTLYSQLRFDYTNKTPAWAPIKTIDISNYTTHHIGDSIWLSGGCLSIGAGNQLFIKDSSLDGNDDATRHIVGKHNLLGAKTTIFEACSIMNGPLPFYHPQFLIQSVFAGKLKTVKKLLVALLKALKFGVVLDSNLIDIETTIGLSVEAVMRIENSSSFKNKLNLFNDQNMSIEDALEEFTEDVSTQLLEWLQKVSLPYMTQHQQITLASVIEAIQQIEQNSRSLDINGIKFLLGYRLFKIHRGIQESMTIRDYNWAMHSESQDILLGLIENPTTPMLWNTIRDLGLPYWTRTDKLRETFENLARNLFTQSNRDPVACSLYYLALKKKQVLLGLWRTAGWNREQTKTMKLLANDFELPKYQTTAKKNAFALLGKHRYEYAAAFFLLGDSLKDSVNVLVKQVGDISLAIAVARVYGGDDHPVFKELLEQTILPKAVKEGDRWMTSWVFWKLGKKNLSIRALVNSPREIVENYLDVKIPIDETEGADNKSFLVDDPVLVVLYRQLRRKHIKLLSDKVIQEFQIVLKKSSIYYRMGCDILALDLVKNWDFISERDIPGSTAANLRSPQAVKNKPKSVFDDFQSSGTNAFGIDDGFDYSQIKKIQQKSVFDKINEASAASTSTLPSSDSNPFGIDDGFDYSSIKKITPTSTTSGSPQPTAKLDSPFGIDDGVDYNKVEKRTGISTPDSSSSKVQEKEPENSEVNKEEEKPPTDAEANAAFKNLKPAAAVAFQEPDMSAFDFGF